MKTKKQLINRISSLVLCLVMIVGMFPITALAEYNPHLYFADVLVINNATLKNANPIPGASVSYDSATNSATITLNGVNTDKHNLFNNGGAIESFDLSHLYIVIADGSENNFEVSWWGADKLSFIYATCPVTISGNGTINVVMNNISGTSYGYNLRYTWGMRSTNGNITICDGANVNIAMDLSSNTCYGVQAGNVILRDANLSVDIYNKDSSTTTACLNGTASLISGSLSMKTNKGDIGGTVSAEGATSSTAPDGTVTYTMTSHNWAYSASGNTIKAWCSKINHNCAYFGEEKALGLTITAADTTYEKKDITTTNTIEIMGGSYEITTTNSVSTNHPGATLNNSISAITSDKNASITYIGTGETDYNSTTPPSNAGTYIARVTLGGVSATDDFTIAKADLAYTAPTVKDNLTYQDNAQQLINAGSVTTQWYNINQPSACGRMEYRLGTTGEWSMEIPAAKEVGTYQVYWRVVPAEDYSKNYTSYESSEPLTVSIAALDMGTISVWQDGKLTYDGGKTLTPTVTANATTVNNQPITFTYSTSENVTYGSMPTFTKAGTYTVYFKATASNHNESTGSFTVTVDKATVTEPTIASKSYTGSVQTADIVDTDFYTVEQNNGAIDAGNYDVVLKLNDSENYKWATTDDAEVTLQFRIVQARNAWVTAPSISGWTYGETANAPTGEAKFGTIEVLYSGTANNGTTHDSYTPPTKAGTYVAMFSVNGTANYEPISEHVQFIIAKADRVAPTGIGKEDETISKKEDGKITGVDSAMEYRAESESTYTAITGREIENLAAGKYYVRVKSDSNHNASPDTAVTIAAGRKLKINVPQNQVGYTLTSDVYEFDYLDNAKLSFALKEGYSKQEGFKISLNGNPDAQWLNGELPLSGIYTDVNIVVEGVADITSPDVEINVKENKWTSFLNGLTFGLFFKETQDVTITATDKGSGVKSVQYYLSEVEQGLDELSAINDWQEYNGTFKIDEERRYIIYARVTDNSGNIMCINSDGIILDKTAPIIYGIEEGGKYYGMNVFTFNDEHSGIASLKIDGVETAYAPAEPCICITPDNAEHTVTVTDMAGNVTEYHITVYKNYTVTFKADDATVDTQIVGYGKDATLPAIPAKEGFVGKWDAEGKNITNETTISVVYTEIPAVKPDEVKPEDKTDLEDTKARLEEMLEDDSYTDDDKKDIQDAIDDIDDALEVIGNVEAVEELIDKLPENITGNDEDAIKAADDAYNALSDYEKSLVDEAAKKALTDAKAALAELNKPADTDSPQTGDNSNMFLWIALLFISGGAVITLTVVDRKRRMASNR